MWSRSYQAILPSMSWQGHFWRVLDPSWENLWLWWCFAQWWHFLWSRSLGLHCWLLLSKFRILSMSSANVFFADGHWMGTAKMCEDCVAWNLQYVVCLLEFAIMPFHPSLFYHSYFFFFIASFRYNLLPLRRRYHLFPNLLSAPAQCLFPTTEV